MIEVSKVTIGGGPAQFETTIDGREMSYAGVWSLSIIDQQQNYFSVSCMVPGEISMMSSAFAAMKWSTSDYVLEIEAVTDKGDIPIDAALVQELQEVLKKIKDGDIKATDHYGKEIVPEYIRQIVNFLIPRLEFVPQSLEGGVATKARIEASMKAREIRPLPKA